MEKIKKFDIEFVERYGSNSEYEKYRVVGLDCAYYGLGECDFANGACGLIKQDDYPGYCQLCFVFHTKGSENFGSNGYTVEFMPLLTKDGERILLKYEHDCLMCVFECGSINYGELGEDGKYTRNDGTITFITNGVCKIL